MQEIKTNDGKKGGWLKGKRHNDKSGNPIGGIKAIVVDTGKPVELEGGEVIINREASKKYWKELSRINQSAGNGVAIGPPGDSFDEDPSEDYEKGGKIEFNANHVPNKYIFKYAEKIKNNHPEIWKLGGNIFGNEAFENLSRVSKRGYWLDSEEWMYVKWRAYVARHKQDFRIEGVVAMLKWVDKVDRGWTYMKNLIESEITDKKEKGGNLIKRADGSYSKHGLWDSIRENAGSGKEPTKEMLEQEAKIKGEKYEVGGDVTDKREIVRKKLLATFDYLPNNLKFLGKGLNGYAFLVDIDNELYVVKYTKSLTEFYLTEMAFVSNPPNVVTIKDVKKISENYEYGIIHKYVDIEGKPNEAVWNVAVGIKFKEYLQKQNSVPLKELNHVKALAKKYQNEIENYFGFSVDVAQSNWGYEDGKLVLFDIDGDVKKSQYEEWIKKHSNNTEKYHLGGDMSKHLAPNNKPSNLNHEQWHLVRTPAFKTWFGDWESLALKKLNDSGIDEVSLKRLEDAVSKVVDENGEPLVVYHGTQNDFKKNKDEVIFDTKYDGAHFGTLETTYDFYPTTTYPVFLNVKNLKNGLDQEIFVNKIIEEVKKEYGTEFLTAKMLKEVQNRMPLYREQLKPNFDGIKYLNIMEGNKNSFSYVVFEPNQIKLADGTNTTFDGNNPDIRFKDGGPIELSNCIDFIKKSEAIKNNGYYFEFKSLLLSLGAYDIEVPKIDSLVLITYNSGGQKSVNAIDTINSIELANNLSKLLEVDIAIARILVHEQMINSKRFEIGLLHEISNKNIVVADRDKIVCTSFWKENKAEKGSEKFMKWYIDWHKGISDKMNIYFSLPNQISPFKEKNIVVLDIFEKIDQNIDAKKYLNKIIEKADEYGITIYLEPKPRHKYILNDVDKVNKISKDYLIEYYQKFGFKLTSDKNFMKRLPNSNLGIRFEKGGTTNTNYDELYQVYIYEHNEPIKVFESYNINEAKSVLNEQKRLGKKEAHIQYSFAKGGNVDQKDSVTMDIPLLIRTLELSREDIHSDVELHQVVENLISLKNKPVLTMDDYKYIANIKHKHIDKMKEGGSIPTFGHINYDLYNPKLEEKLYQEAQKYFSKKYTDDYWHFATQYFNGNEITYEVYSEKGGFWLNFKVLNNKLVLSSARVESIHKMKQGGPIEINKYHLGGDMSKHLAPNGKPSNLNHEQWHLVRTPEFKAWFGDWENSPKNASKVVDENGEPLVVWRGESKNFNVFDYKKLGSKLKTAWRNAGFFFAPTKSSAEQYMFFMGSGILKQFFLNIKNPYTLDSEEFFGTMDWGSLPTQKFKSNKLATDFANNKIAEIKSENSDGAFVTVIKNDNVVEIIAFNPNQIKLADGSNTTFDSNNPDIRFEDGGNIDSFESQKSSLLAEAERLSDLKKQLYSDVDISSPKSAGEKELDRNIAEIYSRINRMIMSKSETENYMSLNILSYKNPYELNRAIERLLDLKGEERDEYSPDEISFIGYYSGYGGLEKQGKFEINELKGLLYEYFTPDAVVQKMWGLAYKYGYGTIGDNSVFEPSTGVGAFIKYVPFGVRVAGNEINKYSAKICKILYPNAHITLQPFEKNFIKNNLSIKENIQDIPKYSMLIGNPPYGELKSKFIGMGEDKFTTAQNWIEYFIVRGLDMLHPGGLLIYIVGAEQRNGGTLFLDSKMSKVKQMIFDKAELLDAYRLPVNIFERTGVSSEILVFKKR